MRIVLALCVALVLTVGLAMSSASVKPQTISLLEVDTSFAPTGGWDETGGVPPAIGQGFAFGGVVYRWAGARRGKAVGHIAVLCTRVTQTHLLCHGAFFLPGGTIEVMAPVSVEGEAPVNASVVGGTGVYAGARGALRSTTIGGEDSNKSSLVIHLL